MALTKEEKNARNRAYTAKSRAKAKGESVPTAPTTGPVEVKLNPQLDAFLGGSATKPNPNPVAQPNPAAGPTTATGARTPVTNMAAMPIPPALFKFADASMRKVFKKEIAEDVANGEPAPDPLDTEQAQALAQGCEEMLTFYKIKGSPAYAFGIMIFFWILPYLLMIPKKLENSKKEQETKEVKEDGRKPAAPAATSWLRHREREPDKPQPNIIITERPEPGGTTATATPITTSEQLIRASHDCRAAGLGKELACGNDASTTAWIAPAGEKSPDQLASKRGHALL